MKKSLILLLIAMATLCAFVSCEQGEKTAKIVPYLAEVELDYVGTSTTPAAQLLDLDLYIAKPGKDGNYETTVTDLYTDPNCTIKSNYKICFQSNNGQFRVQLSEGNNILFYSSYKTVSVMSLSTPTSLLNVSSKYDIDWYPASGFTGTIETDFEGPSSFDLVQ